VYGGINDWLASGLGSGRVALIGDEHPGGGGPGRILKLDEKTTLSSLQERVKKHLGLTQIQVALAIDNPIKEVQSVAICAGSGGSLLLGVDADVYFTGEMSHHEVLAAIASGRNVILCGHTNTERGYLPVLASKLRAELAKLDSEGKEFEAASVHISQEDRHPLDFV
jgi:putative NIF3 family GTP cyclohydrolase 1 type 2